MYSQHRYMEHSNWSALEHVNTGVMGAVSPPWGHKEGLRPSGYKGAMPPIRVWALKAQGFL